MKLIKRLFYSYSWCCAYRVLDENEIQASIIPESNEIRNYTIIKTTKDQWIADPFLIELFGETRAFFELTHIKNDKATIGTMALTPPSKNGVKEMVADVIEFDGHVSYPCVFKYGNEIYMIPETCADKTVCLLKCVCWPYRWERVAKLLSNVNAVDSTPFFIDDKVYLFIYEIDKQDPSLRRLSIAEIDFEKKAIKDIIPVKNYSSKDGRPGGHVFFEGEELIRPVQPWEKYYGERLDFYRFTYQNGKFHEEKCGVFLPSQVRLDKKIKIDGIHTINRYGKYEIIDIRVAYRFDLLKPIKKLFQMCGVFGFDHADGKKKRIRKKDINVSQM